MSEAPERRVDLDWIRIGAFAALILYHVGMYYVTWGWHVKSPHASAALEPLMMLTNPWRLALLFLVSGAATAFMAARMSSSKLAGSRSARLLVPLAFAVFVIVPPQSYLEVVQKLGYADGFPAFYARYLQADHTFCRESCLILPTWNHLWFVAYLWVYTLLVAAGIAWAPRARQSATAALTRALSGWGVIVWPWLVLAAARILLAGRFPQTLAFYDDWYNHALFLPVFVLGFLVATADPVWAAMERMRWIALALFLVSYAFIAWYFYGRSDPRATPEALRIFQRGVYALDQWCAIVAACGFARRHIHRDGPARRYLTDAIFPFYIVHQTAIIAFAVAMRPLDLSPAIEAPLLVALVLLTCVGTYEIVKRATLLRPLFGLKAR